MKKVIVLFLFLCLIAMAVSCKSEEKHVINNEDTVTKNENSKTNIYYFGEGKEWFATYTISKVKTSYFDSLYIQYINNRNAAVEEQTSKKIGKIEYILNAGETSIESSFPQQLKGIGNFHTACETNAEIVDTNFPEEIKLEIRWQDKKENILLKKKN